MSRDRFRGVRHVVAFNWPAYAVAALTWAVSRAAARSRRRPFRAAGAVAGGLAAWWSAASLVASHWVHDRAGLHELGWIDGLVPPPRRWLALHAGLDEFSPELAARYGPGEVIDFYDPVHLPERSIARARGAASATRPIERLELAAASYDTIFVLLALHEVRDDALRAAFLAQLRDALAPAGRIVLLDHLRDAANVVAFGPGARHFLPAARYRGAIAAAGLAVAGERAITPFVRAFALRR